MNKLIFKNRNIYLESEEGFDCIGWFHSLDNGDCYLQFADRYDFDETDMTSADWRAIADKLDVLNEEQSND